MESNCLTSKNQGRLHFLLLLLVHLSLVCAGCLHHNREELSLLAMGTRGHFDQEGPNIQLYPLVDNTEVMAVIVRVASVDDIKKDFKGQDTVESKGSYSNTYHLFGDQDGICCQGKGARLSLDGHVYQFNKKALAEGPWIYCFDYSKAPFRIQIPQSDKNQFESDVYELPPLEFVTRWCDPMLGEPLSNGEFIK